LIGSVNWAEEVHDEISEMRMKNFAIELRGLEKRRHKSQIARRLAEGPRDQWRSTRHGPLRDVILIANGKWFEGDCVHARANRDEEVYHIHAVILPRARTTDGQRMLQPSKHGLIRHYEAGQDSVGAWFAAADINLKRGERRKQQNGDALEHNAKIRKGKADAAAGAVVGLAELAVRKHGAIPTHGTGVVLKPLLGS
jgi:hypothetical protein